MKTPHSLGYRFVIVALLFFNPPVRAENVTVYHCVSGQDGAVSVGHNLAVFKSGKKSLMTVL